MSINLFYQHLRVLTLLFSLVTAPSVASEVNIAVASNFTHTMNALVKVFEKNYSEHNVNVSFGSSGKIYAQIIHGAPFDMFFSADQDKPSMLVRKNRALAESQFTYAQGQLVLWSNHSKWHDLANSDGGGAAILQTGMYQSLAFANPRLAPYGLASTQVLDYLNVNQAKNKTWVQGENISQTFQFVRSGNIDLGFISLSQVLMLKPENKGQYWKIPVHMYQPILQDMVLLNRAQNNSAAKAFLAFIKSALGQKIIRANGYLLFDAKAERHLQESVL